MSRLNFPTAWVLTCLALACSAPVAQAREDAHGAAHGTAHEPAMKESPKDAHKDANKEAQKEAAKAAPKESKEDAARGGGDSMEALRLKLAERLGAVKAPEARSPYVVRVANKASGGGDADAPRARSAATSPTRAMQVAAASTRESAGTGIVEHVAAAGHGGEAHWDYTGEFGPQTWGSMKPEFAKCATGNRQSPIDIRSGIQVQLPAIQFEYQPTGFSVVDNGHTVQVNLPGGNAITVNGRRYDLVQFHFHRPSEERINGRQFDMVVHLVHKDPDGRLAVVAIMLERGAAQPLIQSVWNALPLEKGEEVPAPEVIDLRQLLPTDTRYFTYMGSLTTPPCSEGVLWLVMKQSVQVSVDQIGIFARLYPMNARPIQPNSGRLIKESN